LDLTVIWSPPSSALVAGSQSLALSLILLGFGLVLATAVIGTQNADSVFRLGMALPAVTLFALLLQVAHMILGGVVWSHPVVVRVALVSVGVAGLLVAVRRRGRGSDKAGGAGPLLLFLVLGIVVWCLPIFWSLPAYYGYDVPKHAAWASQLLAGESTPSALITGDVPNFYPWLFHALLAMAADLIPGGRALHALGAVQPLIVMGGVATLFALGREVAGHWYGGAATALFGALTGGFGWAISGGPHLVMDPRAGNGAAASQYLGDLLFVRSYNLGFANIVPPNPRDLSYALLPAVLLLLLMALRRRSLAAFSAAGVVVGLLGLTNAEAFLVGFPTALVIALLASRPGRMKSLAAVAIPAVVVYLFWAGPLLINYVKFGGFVNLTTIPPVLLSPQDILGSWGIVTPFALCGALVWLPRAYRTPPGIVVIATMAVSGVAVIVSSAAMGGTTPFQTLLRPHRYWPLFFLGVALLAGPGAAWAFAIARRVSVIAAAVLAALLMACAVASPVVASRAVPRTNQGPLYESLTGNNGALFNVLSVAPHARCSMAVPTWLADEATAYTGYRVVQLFAGHRRNPGRIRWPGIYHSIPGYRKRSAANRILTTAVGPAGGWLRTARGFGVDLVVLPSTRRNAPALGGARVHHVSGEPYVVARIGSCRSNGSFAAQTPVYRTGAAGSLPKQPVPRPQDEGAAL
jgi:hypothetical protein